MFKHILFATDFSPLSRGLLKYAAAFARQANGRVTLLNVQSASLPAQALRLSERALAENGYEWLVGIRRELEEMLQHETLQGLDAHAMLAEGDPATEILRVAREKDVSLLVMATQRRGFLARPLIGSTALAVLEESPCPALVARPPCRDFVYYKGAETTIALNRILLATDFDPVTDAAKQLAFDLAKAHDAKVTALHAIHIVLGYFPMRAKSGEDDAVALVRRNAEARFEGLASEAAAAGIKFESRLVDGRAYEATLKTAQELEADLIVMGCGDRQAGQPLGHHVERVIRETTCPLLVVPPAAATQS
ncbi:MAG: universal stress protein [Chloracidobacterium sp.]|uniref:Universal stress protein n=1 Tax=Chloracidobacterium validum TaxID=2821543 RepID=A0ABX8B5A4_9BACT|nr:universal stress protein [Chloracidobacterium validum]QUW02154.1 universal stress protein [Chloracidobacterium validum]